MKKNLLLSLALLFSVIVSAQEPSKIKVYTPSSNSSNGSSKNDNSYKWSVKTDVFSFLTGEFPVVGEYRVSNKLSVEGSVGLTYSFLENNFLLDEEDNFSSSSTKPGMGSAFRGTIKYFPSSDYDAIEGWYFGVQLFNKTNNRKYVEDEFNSNSTIYSGKEDKKVKTGASIIIGKQIFADSNVVFDSYIGIGFANNTRKYYGTFYEYDSVGDTYNYVTKSVETEEVKPNFQVGFRIGFGN